MMRQTFTIAGSLALVSLFGFANAGYAQTVKSDAPLALGQNAVAVKAIAAKDGTFDVEITENGKTRKLTGVKAKADGSLDIPELNGDAPKGAKVEKQIKIITSDGSNAGIALPDTANRVEIDASDIVIDAQGLPLADIAPGTTVTVTASAAGNAPVIVKTGRVVAGKAAGT